MESAKLNIKQVVAAYIKACPEEFAQFKEDMVHRRGAMTDQEFGTTSGDMRALFEMPVTLHDMLVHNLTSDQLEWFKKGGDRGLEGGRWFANTFPVFALPRSI